MLTPTVTPITADDLRNARLMGQDAVNTLLNRIPSVENATSAEVERFIAAMERPHA